MTAEKGPRPGPSAYEDRFLDKTKDDEDRAEWNLIVELDPTTGRVLKGPFWHKPFGRHLPS